MCRNDENIYWRELMSPLGHIPRSARTFMRIYTLYIIHIFIGMISRMRGYDLPSGGQKVHLRQKIICAGHRACSVHVWIQRAVDM